jgi:Cu-Zn family superoxide dismutase
MRPIVFAAALAFAPVAAYAASAQTQPTASPPEPIGTAMLKTADGTDAGSVTAYRGPLGLLFRVEGRNWPAGWHGVHLHMTGTCEGPGFTSAGGHVDHPTQDRAHGLLNMNGGPELGDLQNVYAASDGTARAEVYAAGSQTSERGHDLMDADGLSFIVHANPDDHVSQPIGGAGARIACGVFAPAP